MADPGLSAAALHFGEAMCAPGDMECARRVGQAWEQDIYARFGLLTQRSNGGNGQPKQLQMQRMDLYGKSGKKLGTLSMIDKQVMLCYDMPSNEAGRVCGPVGVGNESWETAQAMLALQGVSVRGV